MMAHNFSLLVKQERIDTYYFRLMLVLVIPRLKLRFLFLIWDFILFLMLLRVLANKLCSWRSQKIQDLWDQCSGRSWGLLRTLSPTLKMPYHKSKGPLFTLALLNNFILAKVKEVCLAGWIFLRLAKYYSSHLKILCKDEIWHYCSCR